MKARIAATMVPAPLGLDDEREGDAEQRQRLDESDTDEHGCAHLPRVFGLTSHGLDGLADQDPEPDARSDRGETDHEAPADRGQALEVSRELREQCQHAASLVSVP